MSLTKLPVIIVSILTCMCVHACVRAHACEVHMQYTMNKSFSSGLFLSVLNRHGGKCIVIPVLWSIAICQAAGDQS